MTDPNGSDTALADAFDFDYTAEEMRGPLFWERTAEMRAMHPVVRTKPWGFWAVTTMDAVLEVMQDWQTFTSARGVSQTRPSFEDVPPFVPIELDPPRQRTFRKGVNPALAAKVVAGFEPAIRDVIDELIDGVIEQYGATGSCDIAAELNRKFPGTVFFRLIVHSSDEAFRRAEAAGRTMSFETDRELFTAAATDLRCWAAETLESRVDGPDLDDLVNAVARLNGEADAFEDVELMTGLQLLAMGGIGTSASALGSIIIALDRDQELQERVAADLSLVPPLVEECLRLEPPVPIMFRRATRDVEFRGVQMKENDWVGAFLGGANRDPAVYDRPDDVIIDRPRVPHVAFGAGPHHCIGSHLGRLQLRIAVEQVLTRLAPFRIPDRTRIQYYSVQSRGAASIPFEFDGHKVSQ